MTKPFERDPEAIFEFDPELKCECLDQEYAGVETKGDYKGCFISTCKDCGDKWYSKEEKYARGGWGAA